MHIKKNLRQNSEVLYILTYILLSDKEIFQEK